jgi:hypothetical protein
MLKPVRKPRLPENELAYILAALRTGIDPGKVARELASGNFYELGIARCLVDIASARLWHAEGVPIADVLTMLEVRHWSGRSTTDCRAYAIEILWTAKNQFDANKNQRNPAPKEIKYAVA